MRPKRKSRYIAPVVLYYTQMKQDDDATAKTPCVFAECTYSGLRCGPAWGHSYSAKAKVTHELARECDCGRRLHHVKYYEGKKRRANKKAA
jgi:hypothetical protein